MEARNEYWINIYDNFIDPKCRSIECERIHIHSLVKQRHNSMMTKLSTFFNCFEICSSAGFSIFFSTFSWIKFRVHETYLLSYENYLPMNSSENWVSVYLMSAFWWLLLGRNMWRNEFNFLVHHIDRIQMLISMHCAAIRHCAWKWFLDLKCVRVCRCQNYHKYNGVCAILWNKWNPLSALNT